jgi:hypothetical protein
MVNLCYLEISQQHSFSQQGFHNKADQIKTLVEKVKLQTSCDTYGSVSPTHHLVLEELLF